MPRKRPHETARFQALKQEAYIGLRNRTLGPLIYYLIALEATAESDFVLGSEGEMKKVFKQHSPLVRELRILAYGSAEQSEIQLQFVAHPDAKKGKLSKSYRQAQDGAETKTAIIMAKHGAFERGQFESAMAATLAATNLSRATIARHWRRRRDQVAYLIEVGLF